MKSTLTVLITVLIFVCSFSGTGHSQENAASAPSSAAPTTTESKAESMTESPEPRGGKGGKRARLMSPATTRYRSKQECKDRCGPFYESLKQQTAGGSGEKPLSWSCVAPGKQGRQESLATTIWRCKVNWSEDLPSGEDRSHQENPR